MLQPDGPTQSDLRARLRALFGKRASAILVVTLLAGILRFWGLGYPPNRVFDEAFYPRSACWLLGWSDLRCDVEEGRLADWVHPPLGKYAIALGELALGFDASDGLSERDTLSFRLPSAVAGTVTVALLTLAASMLFGSVGWTWLAGALLAVEGLSVVHSRVGMLDAFLALWVVAAFVAFLLDQASEERRNRPVPDRPSHDGPSSRLETLRPWRIACGVFLGAAIATKWSGAMALVPIVVLGVLWDHARHPWSDRRHFRSEAARLLVTFVVLPVSVYLLSYSAFFAQPGVTFGDFIHGTAEMARFHQRLVDDDPPCNSRLSATSCEEEITSRPWEWLILRKPIVYWGEGTAQRKAMVLGNGNAAIFWGSLVAIPLALFLGLRRRDRAAAAIAVMALSLYLPWFFVRRVEYLFYAVPMAPLLVLAFVVLVRQVSKKGWHALASALCVYAIGLGLLMWPIHAARPLSPEAWSVLARAFPAWWGRF